MSAITFDYTGSYRSVDHTLSYYGGLNTDYVNEADIKDNPSTGKTVTILDNPNQEGNQSYSREVRYEGAFYGDPVSAYLPTSSYFYSLSLVSDAGFRIYASAPAFPRVNDYLKSTYSYANASQSYVDQTKYLNAAMKWYDDVDALSAKRADFGDSGGTVGVFTSDVPVLISTLTPSSIETLAADSTILGSAYADRLEGGTGSDKIEGRGGNDTISESSIGDVNTIDGGAGFDILNYNNAGSQADSQAVSINGGVKGTDALSDMVTNVEEIRATRFGDSIRLLNATTLWAGGGNDLVLGSDQNDTLFGEAGDDIVAGGKGNDVIDGGSDKGILAGGDGADTVTGGSLSDIIYGGRGNISVLFSGKSSPIYVVDSNDGWADKLVGGAGSDDLISWSGGKAGDRDELDGGAGVDRYLVDGFHRQSKLVGANHASDQITNWEDGESVFLLGAHLPEQGRDISVRGTGLSGPDGGYVAFIGGNGTLSGGFSFANRIRAEDLVVNAANMDGNAAVEIRYAVNQNAVNAEKAEEAARLMVEVFCTAKPLIDAIRDLPSFKKELKEAVKQGWNSSLNLAATADPYAHLANQGVESSTFLEEAVGDEMAKRAETIIDRIGEDLIEHLNDLEEHYCPELEESKIAEIGKLLIKPFPWADKIVTIGEGLIGSVYRAAVFWLEREEQRIRDQAPDPIDIRFENKRIIYDDGGQLPQGTSEDEETIVTPRLNLSLSSLIDNAISSASTGSASNASAGASVQISGNGLANRLVGHAGVDSLFGLAGTDRLYGKAGNDHLDGGQGADLLDGGPGNDTYYVDSHDDVVIEIVGQGRDTVAARSSYKLAVEAEIELLKTTSIGGTSAIDLTGNRFSQTITGNAGDNVLSTGGGAADVLRGLGGNDTYRVFNARDTIEEGVGQGDADKVVTAVSYVLGADADMEIVSTNGSTGTAPINLTGNRFSQQITGNAGANVLSDGGGAGDLLKGLGGNDTYLIYSTATRIVETSSQGDSDRVAAGVYYVLGDDVHVETLSTTSSGGTAAINLTGNALKQTIVGNSGSNILHDGGQGAADTLRGLGGNDTYRVFNSGDIVLEGANEGGYDVVMAAVDYVLTPGAYIERLATNGTAGTSPIKLTGNELDQEVVGNSGTNILDGAAGNDVVKGLGGNDVLRGGAGRDAFVFNTALNASTNVDRVTDFNVTDDAIHLENEIFWSLTTSGTLAASLFKDIGVGTRDADDRILYNSKNGFLYYDADGASSGYSPVKFAVLDNKALLTANDFMII
jgi:Ca2+-binding RTX toxin-like protein